MGGAACNGWRFWSVEGEALAAAERKQRPEPKPKAKGKGGFKLFKRIPGTGLEEGQYRIWCQACQKSFITSEAEPQACPEGHRPDDLELTGAAGTPDE